jgi:hypothetical protein
LSNSPPSSPQVKKTKDTDLLNDVKLMMELQRSEVDSLKQSLVDIKRTSANDVSTLRTQIATLKQFITESLKSNANEMTQLKSQIKSSDLHRVLGNEIATLRSQMTASKQFMTDLQKTLLTELHDRVDFLENMITYQCWVRLPYNKERHVSGKMMTRMVELGCIYSEGGDLNIRNYVQGNGDWNSWMVYASEEDLIDFITALYKTSKPHQLTFPLLTAWLHTTSEHEHNNFRFQLKKLKARIDTLLSCHTSQWGNYPEKSTIFGEAYFTRVENVLTKLHGMGLLK